MLGKLFALIFLLAATNSLVRINIWHDKLKQMCYSRGDNLYQELIARQQLLTSHLSSMHVNLDYSRRWNDCRNDVSSRQKLQLLIDTVQLCMDEQSRLQTDQKEIFLSRLLEVVCDIYVLGGGIIHDRHCTNSTGHKLSACRQIFQEFQMILLPMVYNSVECSKIRKLLVCLENGIRDCNESTRLEFAATNNVIFYTLYGCTNLRSEFEPETVDESVLRVKSESANQPVVRFNFTVIESGNIEGKLEGKKTVVQDQTVVRFNFTKSELREKCNQKGDIYAVNVENTFYEFLPVKLDKQFYIELLTKTPNLTSKEQLENELNENCYNDMEIRNILAKLLNTVEQCLDKEEQLKEVEREQLLIQSINKFCSGLDITASLDPSDQECFHNVTTFLKIDLCSRNVLVDQVYFDNLPLLFTSSPEECNDLYRIQSCKLNVHKNCKNSTKNWLQGLFSQERRFAGCKENLDNSSLDSSFDSSIDELIT